MFKTGSSKQYAPELDAAVLQAYGWSDLGALPWADEAAHAAWTEALLERLVALNAKRAAEEEGRWPGCAPGGIVRWLRPEFQDPARRAALAAAPAPQPEQAGIDGVETKAQAEARADEAEAVAADAGDAVKPQAVAAATTTQPWPPTLPEQVRAVAQLLSASPAPLPLAAIEASFKGKGTWKKGLPRILDALEALGRARRVDTDGGGGWRACGVSRQRWSQPMPIYVASR